MSVKDKIGTSLGVMILVFLAGCSLDLPIAGPTPTPTPAFTFTHDVPYSNGLTLDVYSPSQPGTYPVVVGFHGCPTTKVTFGNLGKALAERGVVVFAVGWTCAPTFADDYLVGEGEAACAIRFVREHAPSYQGDPSRIVVVGHSGGGGIGAAITFGGDSYKGDCLVNTGSALPDGFVGLDGAYPLPIFLSESTKAALGPADLNHMDPFYQITANPLREGVPFHLFVGDEAEELIAFSRDFHQALLDAGYESELTTFTGVNHMGILGYPKQEVIDTIVSMAQGD